MTNALTLPLESASVTFMAYIACKPTKEHGQEPPPSKHRNVWKAPSWLVRDLSESVGEAARRACSPQCGCAVTHGHGVRAEIHVRSGNLPAFPLPKRKAGDFRYLWSQRIPMSSGLPNLSAPAPARSASATSVLSALVVTALAAAAFLWCYWSTLGAMAERWSTDPQYSHGFLVPIFALVVLWSRQARWDSTAKKAPSWFGLILLLAAVGLRLQGAVLDLDFADGISMIPALAGVVLLLGGWPALRWSWPAIAFLAFMVPLPFQVEAALGQPLRRFATVCTTYVLQTLGYPALSEGNVILIDELRLGVIEACSGLGMLVTFFALATAVAIVVRRPLFDRLVIFVSAVPIAIVANIARIAATAIAHEVAGEEFANMIMHDLAGWLMMPLALGLMWLEMAFLAHLLTPVAEQKPLSLVLTDTTGTADREVASEPLRPFVLTRS
jgi:exosortase